MTSTNAIAATVRDAVLDAAAILLPVRCAGCGRPDRSICGACARALTPEPVRRTVQSIPVWTALEYDGRARAILLAYKDGGRTDAAPALAAALRPTIVAAQREAVRAGDAALLPVLIPSTRAARRARGYHPTGVVLARTGALVRPLPRALRLRRQTEDQAGLAVDARAANRRGSMLASPRLRGRDCLLIDDIVTTGATLAEAARAIRAIGGTVVGAAAIARTPLRSERG